MTEGNVERTRRAIVEWNERGVDALLEVLDPEVEWHPPRESMEPGTYRGHDGVRDYLGRLAQVFEIQRVESVDVTSVDDNVVLAVVRISGTSARFGKVDGEWAWMVTMREGRGIQVVTFVDKQEALRAAELLG